MITKNDAALINQCDKMAAQIYELTQNYCTFSMQIMHCLPAKRLAGSKVYWFNIASGDVSGHVDTIEEVHDIFINFIAGFNPVVEVEAGRNCITGDHESDDQIYLSDPPSYKCKHCGELYR